MYLYDKVAGEIVNFRNGEVSRETYHKVFFDST